jgi:hypothetical protein
LTRWEKKGKGPKREKGIEITKRWYPNGMKGYVESVETLSPGRRRTWTIKSPDTDSNR